MQEKLSKKSGNERKLLSRLATDGLVISIDLVNGKNNHREPFNCFSAELLSTSLCLQRLIRSPNHNLKLNSKRQIREFFFNGGMLQTLLSSMAHKSNDQWLWFSENYLQGTSNISAKPNIR